MNDKESRCIKTLEMENTTTTTMHEITDLC